MHSAFSSMERFPSQDARYSSPRLTPPALGRRRPLPAAQTAAYPLQTMENSSVNIMAINPMATALHNLASTSGDESSAEEAKAGKKRKNQSQKTPKQRKERKPTHTLRKEQKMELLAQIEQLQAQLDNLKSQAIVSNALHVKKHTQAPVMNVILRDAVQARQSTLADVQGLVSGYVQQQHDISPINTCIKLGLERTQRHCELVAMKHEKLVATREFLLRRSRGLEPGRQYCEEERFETSRGDYCAIRFAVAHFRGAASVRAVFDAALFHIANVEISMSEVLGNITIREDDDNGEDNVTQLRLVSSTGTAPEAPPLETNSVQFNEFHEATTTGGENGAGSSEFGIILGDFVDEDERYPYRPTERLRKDVTAALLVTRLPKEDQRHTHRSGKIPTVDTKARGGSEGELVVKVTLWSLIKLHHSDLEVSYDCLEETRHEIGRWGEEMVRAMSRTLSLKQAH